MLSLCCAGGSGLGASENDDSVDAAAVVQPSDAKVAGESKDESDKAAANPKEQVAPEGVAEEKPAEPKPVGKLGIRKGTGRPAGQPRVVNDFLAAPHRDVRIQEPIDDLAPLNSMREELEPQLRPVLHAEIYFVHLVCETNRQERQQLITAMEPEFAKAVTAAARQAIAAGNAVNPGMVIRRGTAAEDPQTLALTMIRKSLVHQAAIVLGEERFATLREEHEHRIEAERRAAISNIITQLDAFLGLSAEQQEKLVEQLLKSWRDEWRSIQPQVHAQYAAEIWLPPAALRILSADQQKRWASLPKISFATHIVQQFGVNRSEAADRWKAELKRLDGMEQEGEQSQ